MADTTLNFTLFSSSPMFNFGPMVSAGAGSAQTGWQYNQTGDSGLYFTTLPGASMEFQFYGTGIQLQGSAGCPFTVAVDNQTTTHSLASGLIFETTGLQQGTHNVNLTVGSDAGPDAEIIFSSAVITDTFPVGQVPLETTFDAASGSLSYFGPWDKFSNGTSQTTYPGASVSVNFTGPAIVVMGPSGTASSFGQYYVTVDSNPPILVFTTAIGAAETQLFYQSGLDPNELHSVTVTNTGGSVFAFDYIEVWESTSITSSPVASGTAVAAISTGGSHSNIVKIVVPIVAVVAALLILVTALLFRRRRQRRRTATLSGPFAMRLSRTFGKSGSNALSLSNLQPKGEQPVDGTDSAPVEFGQTQKA